MKKIIKNPLFILAVAAVLLLGSSVGAARAALVYQSQRSDVTFSTAEISVQLFENDQDVSTYETPNTLAFQNIAADNNFKVGKQYAEKISVVNNSSETYQYPEYVRVIVTKSWVNADGTKDTTLDPSLIKLNIKDGWTAVQGNAEQTTYYMTTPLAYGNEAVLADAISIDDSITTYVTKTESKDSTGTYTTITTTYDYNGKTFQIEVEADAVQTHNAADAIHGAWGINATVAADGTLSIQ